MRRIKGNAILFMQRIFGRLVRFLLGPHVVALVVRIPSGTFAVDPEDNGVGGHMRRRGSYAEGELARIYSLVGPDNRVLVVGAHVGTLAIPVAKRCAEVVAIEANPRTYELLRMNLALSGVANCKPLHIAVSDRPEVIEFQLARNNSGNSKRRPKTADYTDRYDRPETISVSAARLDDLFPGETFDVILMDIEGSEYFALKGMPELLKRAAALIVEFSPEAIRNVSGVTLGDFLGAIEPYFSNVFVPSRGERLGRARFQEVLGGMFERDESDVGLVFGKE